MARKNRWRAGRDVSCGTSPLPVAVHLGRVKWRTEGRQKFKKKRRRGIHGSGGGLLGSLVKGHRTSEDTLSKGNSKRWSKFRVTVPGHPTRPHHFVHRTARYRWHRLGPPPTGRFRCTCTKNIKKLQHRRRKQAPNNEKPLEPAWFCCWHKNKQDVACIHFETGMSPHVGDSGIPISCTGTTISFPSYFWSSVFFVPFVQFALAFITRQGQRRLARNFFLQTNWKSAASQRAILLLSSFLSEHKRERKRKTETNGQGTWAAYIFWSPYVTFKILFKFSFDECTWKARCIWMLGRPRLIFCDIFFLPLFHESDSRTPKTAQGEERYKTKRGAGIAGSEMTAPFIQLPQALDSQGKYFSFVHIVAWFPLHAKK